MAPELLRLSVRCSRNRKKGVKATFEWFLVICLLKSSDNLFELDGIFLASRIRLDSIENATLLFFFLFLLSFDLSFSDYFSKRYLSSLWFCVFRRNPQGKEYCPVALILFFQGCWSKDE